MGVEQAVGATAIAPGCATTERRKPPAASPANACPT
jgi:hypothetical protein